MLIQGLIIFSATSLRLGSTQNVMRVATHMDHVQLPMLLPGITATTSLTISRTERWPRLAATESLPKCGRSLPNKAALPRRIC
jgi:hypothetical protein